MSSTQQLLLGEGAGGSIPVYIEEVFSTQVYTGAGTSNTILNYIDLATKGGLVWTKLRASPGGNAPNHRLSDSAIGVDQVLSSNNTDPKTSSASFGISAFNSDGYTITNPGGNGGWNFTNDTFVSWTFRKQPKFFDVLTYTGDNVIGREIPHNLGSVPGCIIVKQTNASREWAVYHTSLGNTKYINLNSAGGAGTLTYWNNTSPTSTVFTVGDWGAVNQAGSTYVAYLFAHDAGGFGAAGTDNVISCGSYTGNASTTGPIITLGYEPQWVLLKSSTNGGTYWYIVDVMRGMAVTGVTASLTPNSTNAENGYSNMPILKPTATGFQLIQSDSDFNGSGATYIYIAIRRGPMKVPTVGTSVFSPSTASQNSGVIVSGFPVDATILASNSTAGFNSELYSRLTGGGYYLKTSATDAQAYSGVPTMFQYNNGISPARFDPLCLTLMFQRAPSFMDVVCYTGNGSATSQTLTHNLSVVPELMIVKARSGTSNWWTYTATLGATKYLKIDTTAASVASPDAWNDTSPTSSNFTVGFNLTGTLGVTWVAYLFATCAGVSKVGSYTGTGALLTVNCGFTSGARYILIKRTDSTGDWFSYNSASGISSGTDPYLLLNSSAVQVTGTNYVDTTSVGFQVTAAAPSGLNASGGTYIFLAIA